MPSAGFKWPLPASFPLKDWVERTGLSDQVDEAARDLTLGLPAAGRFQLVVQQPSAYGTPAGRLPFPRRPLEWQRDDRKASRKWENKSGARA
jgi:hypothetical protein